MHITPVESNIIFSKKSSSKELTFKHGGESFWKSDYSLKEKSITAGTTALGVFSSLACLSKIKGNSIKPKAFIKYLKTTPIKCPEVITMGIGTCLGGLIGGYIIDKNPLNRKAKRREAIMQMGNISIPIATVALSDELADKIKISKKTTTGKLIRTVSSLGAIVIGIYLANFIMNKISNHIFNDKTQERGVKGTDWFPHIDDVLASAGYILPDNKHVLSIQRIVPFALMVAGNEIGNKKADAFKYKIKGLN